MAPLDGRGTILVFRIPPAGPRLCSLKSENEGCANRWPTQRADANLGIKNYLIEGVSGTGKTSVAEELQRRGYHVLHGDRELKYRGDPETGEPLEEPVHLSERDKVIWQHEHLLWDLAKVQSVIADHSLPVSFFCGGSRNFHHFIDLLDGIFVLEVQEIEMLFQRLDERVALDPTDFGGKPEEKELVARLHSTKEDMPKNGVSIDATAPLDIVVDEILKQVAISSR
eukprot:s1_g2044.t1